MGSSAIGTLNRTSRPGGRTTRRPHPPMEGYAMATVEVQYRGRQGTRYPLETNEDLVAVRTWDRAPVADTRLSSVGRGVLARLEPLERFPHAGVEVFHVRSGAAADR